MGKPKSEYTLAARTPQYVTREVGAAELCISADTWDKWVLAGVLPDPLIIDRTKRWRWADVDAVLVAAAIGIKQDAPEPPKKQFIEAIKNAAQARKRELT